MTRTMAKIIMLVILTLMIATMTTRAMKVVLMVKVGKQPEGWLRVAHLVSRHGR